MNRYRIIQGITLLALAVEAVVSIVGTIRHPIGSPLEMALQPFVAVALWGLLLWKIWTRPRTWALGVAIFLWAAVAFRLHLWFSAAARHPDAVARGEFPIFQLIRSVVPIGVASVGCLLLRFRRDTEKGAGPTEAPNLPHR